MTFEYGNSNKAITFTWNPRDGQEGTIPAIAVNTLDGNSRALLRLPVSGPVVVWLAPASPVVGPDDVLTATVGSELHTQLQCVSNYPATIAFAPGYANPPGLTLTDVTAPRQWLWSGGVGSGTKGGGLGPRPTVAAVLTYAAPRGAEGTSITPCFECRVLPALSQPAKDSATQQPAEKRCITIQVRVCRYATGPGDTLLSVTQRFLLDSNWRRLWNANAALVPDPDSPLPVNTTLSLGPQYEVQAGDTLATIAGRFSATVKGILLANPAAASLPSTSLPAGARLCIPACAHDPAPSQDPASPY